MVAAAIIKSELSTFINTLEVISLMCVYEKHVYSMSPKGAPFNATRWEYILDTNKTVNGADK